LLVSSGSQGFIVQTKTNETGRFAVDGLDFDSVSTLFVQAKNEKGKANTLVLLDKTEVPPLQFLSPQLPANIPFSEAYIQKMKNQQKINDTYTFKNGERVLKEVQVTAKRSVAPEKTRLYGTADNVIKMTDQMASFSNVLQAIQGRVAGVNVTGGGANMQVSIRGGGEPLFLLDEIPVDINMISSLSPTDVETIEILKGASAAIYGVRGGNGVIAVYTKRGGGIVDNRPPTGTTLGKIYGYYKAREFFAPRYDVAREVHNLPDLRSTIYWNPRVKTDSTGKASVTFYNADQVNGLQVVLEGLAPTGAVGSLSVRVPAR
jgi:TonB-dependent SusC/RagA subfamily outer membrane receptor